jgi:hypothetical protein
MIRPTKPSAGRSHREAMACHEENELGSSARLTHPAEQTMPVADQAAQVATVALSKAIALESDRSPYAPGLFQHHAVLDMPVSFLAKHQSFSVPETQRIVSTGYIRHHTACFVVKPIITARHRDTMADTHPALHLTTDTSGNNNGRTIFASR